MHRVLTSVIVFLVLLPTAARAEEKEEAPEVRVWEGFLRKRDGRLEMGFPVVAKGVSAGPAHVVLPKEGLKLDPLVEDGLDYHVFWNYTLEQPHDEVAENLPHVLVRVRGPVRIAAGDDGVLFDAPLHMEPAELLSVEFVDPVWLEHWATLFREKDSPWHIHDEPRPKDLRGRLLVLAPVIRDALQKMRAVPGPSDAQRNRVRKIAPDAGVVTRFRQRTELGIAEWLRAVNDEHELGLEGLDTIPTPPSSQAIQAWFVGSKTKKAFVDRTRSAWRGDLGLLLLPNYVKNGNSTTWIETAVDDVAAWDDATYAKRRTITIGMLGD